MPATTTQRPATSSSLLVTVALALGLAAFSLAPLSCGTESDEASEADTTQAPEANTDRTVLLNIGVNDHTQERPLSAQFLVETPKGNRWSPDPLEGGHVTQAFEKYRVGDNHTFHVYPEGKDGPDLAVPFTMKPDMSSIVASSRTDIFVYDDSLVVTGPAVSGERMTFDRPSSPSNTP